ncbi:MAG TPA: DUF721 domain-containing protein [Pyrinomonadaceae bacterium]|nr:DUF721 domain-containing protein [Pyrinomonadaceae bacterium]
MQDLFRTLPALLSNVEGAEALREAMVFAAWKRIAGESLSERTVPLGLEGKRLSIAVVDKTWKRHLEDLSGQMLFKLNAAIRDRTVDFIEFVIDPMAIENARPSIRQVEDAAVPEDLRAAAASIEDEVLREQFLGAAANCLARRQSRS